MPSKARLNSFLGGFCVDIFFWKIQSITEGLLNGRNNTGINVDILNYFYFQFALFLKWGKWLRPGYGCDLKVQLQDTQPLFAQGKGTHYTERI